MKTYRKISKKFEWTIEKKPTKQYLNISSIPGNARPSAYILRKKNFVTRNTYAHLGK